MADDNKPLKYMRYAIGEVVLVVIGILIALSINNWNEGRKEKQIEKQVLNNLYQDVEKDRLMLQEIDSIYRQDIRGYSKMKNVIWKDQLNLEESLAVKGYTGFVNRDIHPSRSTYDEMISSGKLSYLSNKTLVDKIISYYNLLEDHIYQGRQSRIEFRAFFLESEALTDFWLTQLDFSNTELIITFFNNKNAIAYKRLKIASFWSIGVAAKMNESVFEILEKAKEINKLINEELGNPIAQTDNLPDTLIELSELLKSGKTLDEVIEIAKQQDKDTPIYNISGRAINGLGYWFMKTANKNNDALKLFKLNIELHPNTSNPYDSYGECLLKLGDKENAIKAYQKSLEINPDNENAKKVLSELK